MIIDTSALVAILRDEPESERFADVLAASPENRISTGTWVEAQIVAASYGISRELAELLELAGAELVAFDEVQARLAREAFQRFGKGRHRAGLNFGDCFAYALARALDEPLLFKGDDFSRTDIRAAAP